MSLSASTITPRDFNATLSRYFTAIHAASKPAPPEPLSVLDVWRRTTLPGLIRSRPQPHMLKPELHRLVSCKLKRGKARPILRLIDLNPESQVITTTTAAFACKDLKTSLQTLLTLSGVGPATASYMLAAARFPAVPVFSDEAFRWLVHGSGGNDWSRKIKYEEAEFWDFEQRVAALAQRLGVTADDVERVGFVLGREAAAAAKVGSGGKGAAAKGRKRKVAPDTTTTQDAGRVKKPRAKKTEEKPTATAATGSGRTLRSRKAGN